MTPKVYLEASIPDDALVLYPHSQSQHVNQYNIIPRMTLKEYQEYLLGTQNCIPYTIYDVRSELPIGIIELNKDSLRYHQSAVSLYYWIAKDHENKGYMKQALQQLIDFIFNETSIEVISARVFTDNHASSRLLESLHFQQEGLIRHVYQKDGKTIDEYIYSRLK